MSGSEVFNYHIKALDKKPNFIFTFLLIFVGSVYLIRHATPLEVFIGLLAVGSGIFRQFLYIKMKPISPKGQIILSTDRIEFINPENAVNWLWGDNQRIKIKFPTTEPYLGLFKKENERLVLLISSIENKYIFLKKLTEFCPDLNGISKVKELSDLKCFICFISMSYLVYIAVVLGLLFVVPAAAFFLYAALK